MLLSIAMIFLSIYFCLLKGNFGSKIKGQNSFQPCYIHLRLVKSILSTGKHIKLYYMIKFGELKLVGIRSNNQCWDSSQGPFSGTIKCEATKRWSLFMTDTDTTFPLQGVSWALRYFSSQKKIGHCKHFSLPLICLWSSRLMGFLWLWRLLVFLPMLHLN